MGYTHCNPRLLALAALCLAAQAAILEVTAGSGTEPTVRFTPASGAAATLTADTSGNVTASGDLKTGSANSLDTTASSVATLQSTVNTQATTITTLQSTTSSTASSVATLQSTVNTQATTIATLQSTISSLQATVNQLQVSANLLYSFMGFKIITITGAGNSAFNGNYYFSSYADNDCSWDAGTHRNCECIDCVISDSPCSDMPKLFKQGNVGGNWGIFWNILGCGQTGRYQARNCNNHDPTECTTWTAEDGMTGPVPSLQLKTSRAVAATNAKDLAYS